MVPSMDRWLRDLSENLWWGSGDEGCGRIRFCWPEATNQLASAAGARPKIGDAEGMWLAAVARRVFGAEGMIFASSNATVG